MSDSRIQDWHWAFFSLLTWTALFVIGLDPERAYMYLREAGGVVTQNAWINSPQLITLALAAYVGRFAQLRCLEDGMTAASARSRGIQVAAIGLGGFLWFSPLMLMYARDIPDMVLRNMVYIVLPAKLLAWFYLYIMFFRYYALADRRVFSDMPALIPSAKPEYENGALPEAAHLTANPGEEGGHGDGDA